MNMLLQRCIAPATEHGDCWRACLASVLGLPAKEVPNFVHTAGDDFVVEARRWLAPHGLTIFETWYWENWTLEDVLKWASAHNPQTPIILSGQCVDDENDNHAVILLDGKLAHDPSGAGVIAPAANQNPNDRRNWYLYVVAISASWASLNGGAPEE